MNRLIEQCIGYDSEINPKMVEWVGGTLITQQVFKSDPKNPKNAENARNALSVTKQNLKDFLPAILECFKEPSTCVDPESYTPTTSSTKNYRL